MEFKREIQSRLEEWRRSSRRKPLVLRGARQVGKTTVVNQFGRTFDNYIYLNLEDAEAAALFDLNVPLADLIPFFFAHCKKKRVEGTTLIFIDEIQNSAKAVARLRYFYEQLPEIFVIAAGSLLENLVDVKTSFPVGRVQYMALRPCSFREFLVAVGEGQLLPALADKVMSQAFHERLMLLFNQYVVTGGMPEVVQAFAETRDFASLGDVYETLLQGYRDDSEKYARGGKVSEVVRFILNEGWSKAGQIITLVISARRLIIPGRSERRSACLRRRCFLNWFIRRRRSMSRLLERPAVSLSWCGLTPGLSIMRRRCRRRCCVRAT